MGLASSLRRIFGEIFNLRRYPYFGRARMAPYG
jgi:hypothetical protein